MSGARGAVGMNVEIRDAIIVKRWNEGVASEYIAGAVGLTPRKLREAVRRMRRRGVTLHDRSHGVRNE